jgi:GT2 family glycosyltransferase
VDGAGGRIVPAGPDGLLFRYIAARNPWQPLPSALLASTSRLYRLRLYLREIARLGVTADPPATELFATAGANMAFRKHVLEELGGFDESYRVSEDTEFCRRAHRQRNATRIVYRPGATVQHHFEPHLGGILRRARWYGEGNARFAARHDDVSLIVFPFPILLGLAAAVAAARGPRWARAAVTLLPLLAYSGWVRRAVSRREPEALVYPYLQMAQEAATMAGEASAVLEDLVGAQAPNGRNIAGRP